MKFVKLLSWKDNSDVYEKTHSKLKKSIEYKNKTIQLETFYHSWKDQRQLEILTVVGNTYSTEKDRSEVGNITFQRKPP